MEGRASDWRPGPTVCRCCLTEGCYKDISTEYFWMGKREVYAEMLSETLNVSIAFSKSGGPNSNSRLICEPCIARLRDASEFKRQVVDCEKTFMHHLDPGSSSRAREFNVETAGEVKVEVVKREKASLSDDDFDDRPDFLDVDTDDDLDDQPLTKLASKIPKKESVDLLDLLDSSQITVKRKSNLKLKEAPPKKIIKKKEVVKPSVSKTTPVKQAEKKKELKYPNASAAKRNAEVIVRHSTVYPFRLPENCMVCVFCCESYEEPSAFRRHMDIEHQTFSIRMAFAHCSEGFLKADCSDIRCRICFKPSDSLEGIAIHLRTSHQKPLDLTVPLGIQPFKPDKLKCALCDTKAFGLRQLSRHTQTHFLRFTCESCGKSYATNTALQVHIKYSHIIKEHYCRKCKTKFSSTEAKRNHLQKSTRCWSYLCNMCGDRFISWNTKHLHMKEAHGVAEEPHVCPECGKIFAEKKACRQHFKVAHTDDNFVCSFCGLKFPTKMKYEEHRVIHTNEKPYPCTVCSKMFSRKKNLAQHMWIHSEYKRFECKLCNKKFNQRVSWKSHNKTNHPELLKFEQEQDNSVKYLMSVLKK